MKKIVMGLIIGSTIAMAANYNSGLVLLEKGKDGAAYNEFFELAKSGDVDSQMILGEMYLDGLGVNVNHEKAFFWLSKAASSGDAEAEYLLGFMYENGLYVGESMSRAASWYKKSALQGDVMAQFNLALIYKEGKGDVSKDMKEAFKWLKMVENSEKKISHVASN